MRYRGTAGWAAFVLAAGVVAAGRCEGAAAQKSVEERIRAAMPDRLADAPETPPRLLVFSLCKGFRHGSIPVGKQCFQIMGEKTGAFEAVVSDDVSNFDPDRLKQFDAVLFNNTTGTLPLSEVQKRALLDFVKSGKGFVGIHAATDCFYKWPAYGEMIGGYFNGHPWNQAVAIKLDDPDHPVNAAFKGKGFEVTDEIYTFKAPYSREKLRVLLSLDNERIKNIGKGARNRPDGDFAISWVKSYGRGRVFYCALGHRNDVFWNPALLRHFLDGIRFALGALEADATPSAAAEPAGAMPTDKTITSLTPAEKEAGWRLLFNGKDLSGWKSRRETAWEVEDGVLVRKGGGDIWTEERFGDFVLDLEFKLAKRTNSGVFVRVGSIRNWLHTGIEVQVLDSYGKKRVGKHDCGAIYDCLAPSKNAVNKAGEWNRFVITCKANTITVVLNGEQVIAMDLNKWTEPHKNPDGSRNKFNNAYKDMPREGHIMLQDHGRPISYRNIKLRVLRD